jgi:hypothetical protein
VQIVSGEEYGAREKGLGLAKDTQRFDSCSEPRFHVGGSAPFEEISVHGRWYEREMNRIEVSIELQHGSASSAADADGHGRCPRVAGLRPVDQEAILFKNPRQTVRCGSSIARRARDRDKATGSVEQALTANHASDATGSFDEGVHG